MKVFEGIKFLLVDTHDEEYPIQWMQNIVSGNGGSYITRIPDETSGVIENESISHIISTTCRFSEFSHASDLMVPVTRPEWLQESHHANQRRNYRLFAPLPAPFMDKAVVCIADNLPEGDRDVIYTGVRVFGGQYLDALSRYTTHLITVDLSNNKSVVAANIKKKEGLEIKIVLPQWFDDCLKLQKHVDESPYLLSDPVVLQTGKPNFGQYDMRENDLAASNEPFCNVLLGKKIYLDGNYKLSEHLIDALTSLVRRCGGDFASEFDVDNIDIYLGKYRQGDAFRQCFNDPRIDVATLLWLFSVILRSHYIQPLGSNLLHFPLPDPIIPEFQNLRISVTGYSGDARYYLSQLIVTMGATFTKTLDSHNDFLVSAKATGEKYDAVKSKWPKISLVNHLWIEECFAKWKYLDPSDRKYSSIDSSSQYLGKIRLLTDDLLKWTNGGSESLDIDDSLNEDAQRSIGVSEDIAGEPEISDHQKIASEQQVNASELTKSGKSKESASTTQSPTPNENEVKPVNKLSSEDDEKDVDEVHEVVIVPTQAPERAGRSAKKKAEMKLHSAMENLNEYLSMSKSLRKMKSYMEELDKSMGTPTKKRLSEGPKADGLETPAKKAKTESPKVSKKKNDRPVHMVAIMTGCEQELVLHRAEVVKLSKVGIQIVNDTNSKKNIDTIIAPRVLRTEKFLISLSKASQIIHPSYLADLLKKMANSESSWEELSKEFNIKDYYLDKVVPVKQINDELGISGVGSGLTHLLKHENGLVFQGLQLNLSTNLNGGAALIAGILEAHGLIKSKQIKVTALTSKSNLLVNEDGRCFLIAHKVKDKKLVSNLQDVVTVDWDWCVKSIFQGKLVNYSKYIVGR